MAIDTEAKRKSVVAISAYFLGPVVVADSSIAKFDRQAIGYGYGGISAAAPGGINAGPLVNAIRLKGKVGAGLVNIR